ncbi:MAG: hypothetical protein WC294_00090 [Methanoregula sp.]|jgi:hypothetical protein
MIYQSFPTIIPGTITGLRISNLADHYFLDNLDAAVLQFAGSGNEMHISDGSKTKKVLLGALGTGETYSTILSGAPNFLSGWDVRGGGVIENGTTYYTTANPGGVTLTTPLPILGALYKTSITGTAGGFNSIMDADAATIYLSTWGTTGYVTSKQTGMRQFYIRNTTITSQTIVSALNWDKVLTPSAIGLWYTPVSEESGFNPNAASHTYRILARRRCSGNGGYLV